MLKQQESVADLNKALNDLRRYGKGYSSHRHGEPKGGANSDSGFTAPKALLSAYGFTVQHLACFLFMCARELATASWTKRYSSMQGYYKMCFISLLASPFSQYVFKRSFSTQ